MCKLKIESYCSKTEETHAPFFPAFCLLQGTIDNLCQVALEHHEEQYLQTMILGVDPKHDKTLMFKRNADFTLCV